MAHMIGKKLDFDIQEPVKVGLFYIYIKKKDLYA
jgi:hypothetical protein